MPNILQSKSAHSSQVHFLVQAGSSPTRSVPMIANSASTAAAPPVEMGRLPQPAVAAGPTAATGRVGDRPVGALHAITVDRLARSSIHRSTPGAEEGDHAASRAMSTTLWSKSLLRFIKRESTRSGNDEADRQGVEASSVAGQSHARARMLRRQLARSDPFPPSRFLRTGRSPKSALYEPATYQAVIENLTLRASCRR